MLFLSRNVKKCKKSNKKSLSYIKTIFNYLDKKSNLIQSICAILSVIVIGSVSLKISDKANEISIKANEIADKQLQVSITENKPIISFTLDKGEDGYDTIKINNEGVAPISYNVDVVTFFNFQNSENHLGKELVKIYTWGDNYELKNINDGKGVLAEVTVLNFYSDYVNTINNGVQKLVNKYNNGIWQTELMYVIRIECVDIFENHNYTYILYDGFSCNILTQEFGKELVDEWEYITMGYHSEEFKNEPDHFVIKKDAVTPEKLLKNAITYMREKNLYAKDMNGNIVYYGEYEPDNNE